MGDVISDHISELLGGQGQPLVDEEAEGQEYESQEGDGGGEPPVAEADPQPEGEGEPPAPQAGKRQKVPLAALQEERAKRQNLETQLQQVQQHNQTMEQRFQQMLQMFQQQQQQQAPQQQQEAPQIPAFIDDPEGHVNGLRAQFEEQMRQLQEQNQQLVQARQQQSVVQELAQRSATYEEAFKAQNPDYPQAVEFFAQRKALEYAALGANQYQINQQIQIDVARIAQLSLQQNKDPAQQMYALATALGYTKAAPVPPKPGVKPQQQALPPKAPTSLATVESSVRSPDEEGEITLEAVAHMSDAEFDKYWAKMARGSVQRPKF